MRIENIVYDIKHLLQALTDDTRVNDGHLIFKINNYWAIFLKEEILLSGIINKQYYQRIPLITAYAVTSADDPTVTGGSIRFSKITVPPLLNIGRSEPAMDLWTSQKQDRIYFTDRDLLMSMIENKDDRLEVFKHYIMEGSSVYIYPAVMNVAFAGLLQNPLDSSIFYTTPEALANLVVGVEYIVTAGSVLQESAIKVVYLKGETFTVLANTVYSGNGTVYRSDQVIDATKDMDYPIQPDMAQRIILEILTKDFMLEKQNVVDIFNDAIDQLKTVRTGE